MRVKRKERGALLEEDKWWRKGGRTVSAYVREILQVGHSPGSDGLKLEHNQAQQAHNVINTCTKSCRRPRYEEP